MSSTGPIPAAGPTAGPDSAMAFSSCFSAAWAIGPTILKLTQTAASLRAIRALSAAESCVSTDFFTAATVARAFLLGLPATKLPTCFQYMSPSLW